VEEHLATPARAHPPGGARRGRRRMRWRRPNPGAGRWTRRSGRRGPRAWRLPTAGSCPTWSPSGRPRAVNFLNRDHVPHRIVKLRPGQHFRSGVLEPGETYRVSLVGRPGWSCAPGPWFTAASVRTGRVAASRSTERSPRGATNRRGRRPSARGPSVRTGRRRTEPAGLPRTSPSVTTFADATPGMSSWRTSPTLSSARIGEERGGVAGLHARPRDRGPRRALRDRDHGYRQRFPILASGSGSLSSRAPAWAATSSSRDRAATRAAGPLAARRAARALAGPRASGAERSGPSAKIRDHVR
jgi:hypothetical protein